MSQENKAYIVQLVKQIVHPYFAGEIADILIAHGMTFKTEQQTNADRIRAMSDEELAEFLMKLIGNVQCFAEGMFPYHPCPQNNDCKQCGIEWLQQPAEGG